jgi:multiple antibiotic resistance protein
MPSFQNPILMFTALVALYSPVASLSSYFPILRRLDRASQVKLSVALFIVVTLFALTAIWLGEPLLELLGLSPAAISVTGGIALLYAGIPMMRGLTAAAAEREPGETTETEHWRRVLFMPVFFPLTAGGTTFATMICFRAQSGGIRESLALSLSGMAYAAVTALTIYASGHLQRRVQPKTRGLLERIAGILLVAIAVSLLTKGIPRLVVDTLDGLKAQRAGAASCKPTGDH